MRHVDGDRHAPARPGQVAPHYVFGYGSLLERWNGDGPRADGPVISELKHYRRTWNVAMDNAQAIPGYKLYIDATTGERRDWFVTFLNVVPDERSAVNGVLFEVSRNGLHDLDARERNYARVEVSGDLVEPVDGEVWVYTGIAEAVRRFELGRRARRAVISRDYYEGVLEDFAAIGPGHRQRFLELTDRPPCPVVDLTRVDLPSAPEGPVPVPVTRPSRRA